MFCYKKKYKLKKFFFKEFPPKKESSKNFSLYVLQDYFFFLCMKKRDECVTRKIIAVRTKYKTIC